MLGRPLFEFESRITSCQLNELQFNHPEQKDISMINRIATGLIILGIAFIPAVASAKTYKTEKSCLKHHMMWQGGKCMKG